MALNKRLLRAASLHHWWTGAFAAGTVFERGKTLMLEGHTYFGMRFLPGIKPAFLDGKFSEYNHEQIDLSLCTDDSGYTSRYIEKVFSEAMGISPKKYANILQFQGAIDFIDKNPSANISAVATDFGYYDQPAFIRTFKKYTGMTPKSYSEIIKQYNYLNRIVLC